MLDEYLAKEELDKKTYYDLIQDLKNLGFHLDAAGGITFANEKEVLIRLNSQELKKLKFKTWVAAASKYTTILDEEKKLLARPYHIKPDDLLDNLNPDDKTENYSRDLLRQGSQLTLLQEILNDKQIEILQYQQNYYLLDRNNHQTL